MNILAHRGIWNSMEDRNSREALFRALEAGIGIETDLRDYMGELVISHNVPEKREMPCEELFKKYSELGSSAYLALNVKADGIQDLLMNLINKYNIKNYFAFDMSVPEMVIYRNSGIPYFTRQSDIEQECVLYDNALGVWVDCFYEDWDIEKAISMHLEQGKKVSVISQEIHGKEYSEQWKILKRIDEKYAGKGLYLCTDRPDEAIEYFGGSGFEN